MESFFGNSSFKPKSKDQYLLGGGVVDVSIEETNRVGKDHNTSVFFTWFDYIFVWVIIGLQTLSCLDPLKKKPIADD